MDTERNQQVVNPERKNALEMWLKMNNLKLTQVNGQRKYGGPPREWKGPVPGSGCEVFISHIPRDAFEDVLLPLFSSVGPLWEFRLMMNFSGQNRGFAYAKYSSPATATAAVHALHGYGMEDGSRLSVRRSTEKRHLCLEPLPFDIGREHLLKVLCGLSDGAEAVSLKTGPGIQGMSALVAYSSHHTASMAKKILVEAFKKKYNMTISVKWHSAATASSQGAAARKIPRSLPATPPKPDKYSGGESRTSTPLPPRLLRPPAAPRPFSKAVGGPIAAPMPPPSSCSNGLSEEGWGSLVEANGEAMPSSVVVLRKVCKLYGCGQPLFDIKFSRTCSSGYLYFTYTVQVPGLPEHFTGTVMTLPGPSPAATVEDARCAVADEVLTALNLHYFT